MKLISVSVDLNGLELAQERVPYSMTHASKCIKGQVTISFISDGDFSKFVKKDGTLKRKKIAQILFDELIGKEFEV